MLHDLNKPQELKMVNPDRNLIFLNVELTPTCFTLRGMDHHQRTIVLSIVKI